MIENGRRPGLRIALAIERTAGISPADWWAEVERRAG
jgi:hypothetical protein